MKELFTQMRAALDAAEASIASDSVVEANRKMLLDRSNLGIEKYGTTLEASGLSLAQFHDHALEEALDLANYLQAAKGISAEMQNVIIMLLSGPNLQANRQAALDVLDKTGASHRCGITGTASAMPITPQIPPPTPITPQRLELSADADNLPHAAWLWSQLALAMLSQGHFFNGSDLDKAAEIVRWLRAFGYVATLDDGSGRYHGNGIKKG